MPAMIDDSQARSQAEDTVGRELLTINAVLTRLGYLQNTEQGINAWELQNEECHYPEVLSTEDYQRMYERFGPAERLIKLMPEACWQTDPVIYETEDTEEETAFETEIRELAKKHRLWHYLHRLDELSGVGRFGVLLIGLADGQSLDQPVDTFQLRSDGDLYHGEFSPTSADLERLLFLRPFEEMFATPAHWDTDVQSERFGLPVAYNIIMAAGHPDQSASYISQFESDGSSGGKETGQTTVHWTRVVHVADNKRSSEVFGTPRLQTSYNTLLDCRKILSGSAESLWKGGFPGLSIETQPGMENATVDTDAVNDQVTQYMNTLRRFLFSKGLNVKPLTTSVANPEKHFEIAIKAISIAASVPYRVFMGTEEAKLAGEQDKQDWNRKVERRRAQHVGPFIIEETVQRFIDLGIVTPPAEESGINIAWEDLHAPSDKDKAEVAQIISQAVVSYINGGGRQLFTPLDFLHHVLRIDIEQARQILESAEEELRLEEEELAAAAEDDQLFEQDQQGENINDVDAEQESEQSDANTQGPPESR